jgi:hypothetical protein
LARREQEGGAVRARIEAGQPNLSVIRARLAAARARRGNGGRVCPPYNAATTSC